MQARNPGDWTKTWAASLGLVVLLAAAPKVQAQVDGVVGLEVGGSNPCMAVEVRLEPAQALAGVRWHNNDAQVPFRWIRVVEVTEPGTPDLGVVLGEVLDAAGPSAATAQVDLAVPARGVQGAVCVVFGFPTDRARTGTGDGTGPGIGYVEAASAGAARVWVSDNGQRWARLSDGFTLAFEPILASVPLGYQTQRKASESAVVDRPASGAPRPARTELLAPCPNPFNPSVEVRFTLSDPSRATLGVYNLRGQRVRVLADEVLDPGEYGRPWDGRDAAGEACASSVYVVRLEAGGHVSSRILTLVR